MKPQIIAIHIGQLGRTNMFNTKQKIIIFFFKKLQKDLEIQNKSIIFVSRNNNKNKSNMNYNQKLTSLANEYEATMNHANEVMNEIIETALEQAMVEAFNELTPEEQMALIVGLLCEQVEDSITEELTAVVEAIEKAEQEEEMRRYEEERKREFFKDLEMLSEMHRNGRTVPEPTFLEVGLPEDVLKHLKRLGVKF
jgi:hypothetical protein